MVTADEVGGGNDDVVVNRLHGSSVHREAVEMYDDSHVT